MSGKTKNKKRKVLVCNLFGGPCTGKSTMRARIFSEMKYMQLDCEEVTEYAKDKTWEKAWSLMSNQIFVFANQQHRMFRIMDQVDVLITDSPLLMSIHYDEENNEALKNLVLQQHNSMDTLNFFLERNFEYKSEGRSQTEDGAKEIDRSILNILEENNVQYTKTYSSSDNAKMIADMVKKMIS
jgi:hypothetical protein